MLRFLQTFWMDVWTSFVDAELSEREVQAEEFKKGLLLDDEKDYSWVAEYAKDEYARMAAISDKLDEKANEIVKYLGGGLGLFAIGSILSMTQGNALIFFFGLPSFVAGLFTIFIAIAARSPRRKLVPPSIQTAYEYAAAGKGDIFPAELYIAWAAMNDAVARKARLVKKANWCFLITLALLVFPLCSGIVAFGCQAITPSRACSAPAPCCSCPADPAAAWLAVVGKPSCPCPDASCGFPASLWFADLPSFSSCPPSRV